RIEIRCTPVAHGAVLWRPPGVTTGEPDFVTPLVDFDVEVTGTVPGHDGKDATIAWKLRLDDKGGGKMMERAQPSMIERAFARFLEGVPLRIAESFHEKL